MPGLQLFQVSVQDRLGLDDLVLEIIERMMIGGGHQIALQVLLSVACSILVGSFEGLARLYELQTTC